MRPTLFAALTVLAACGGPSAEVSGNALGIGWGDSKWVYFGGPFITISNVEADCEDLSWVRRNYEQGQAPTDDEVQVLQFAYATDDVGDGTFSVAIDASVAATAVEVKDGAITFERAEAGVLTVDSVDPESSAEGTFEGIAFDSGTLDGSFSAEWCRNLKG